MGDPFSAAGSAVGIVSLGLQVCQGIITYYSRWKDYTAETRSTYESVEQLRGIFDALRVTLESNPLENGSVAEKVRSSIEMCEGGILTLRKRLEKIRINHSEEELRNLNIRRKLEVQGKRLIYPFRQGTLGKLRDAVLELRDNLIPALHALNIDIGGTVLREIRDLKAMQQKWQSEEKNEKILTWLSPLDFAERQSAILSTRHSNSGSWFLELDDFKSWQNNVAGTPLGLWCHGGMGSGKSVIMSIVVNHLQQFLAKDEAVLAYVYCDWQDSKAQTPTNLFGSLLKQLVECMDSIPQNVLDSYTKHKTGRTPLSLDECMTLIGQIASQFCRVVLLIDALDELAYSQNASDASRMIIMESALNNLLTKAVQPINPLQIFTTSRFNQQSETENFNNIKISVKNNDLTDFFRHELNNSTHSSPWTNPELARQIQNDAPLFNSVVERCLAQAGDMFLLATLHLDHVKRQINMRQLHKALESVPNRLHDGIDTALHRLKSQPPTLREIGTSVLLWVTHALRPLRITELQHALAIEPNDDIFLEDGITPQNILVSSCAGLVVLENESGIVRLINFSVKQYLDENPLEWPSSPHHTITRVCTTYLGLKNFKSRTVTEEESIMRAFFAQYPFLTYAAEYWGSHMFLGGGESNLQDAVLAFLLDDKQSGFSFRALYMAVWGQIQTCPAVVGIHLAAYFGLDEQVLRLIGTGKTVDSTDSFGRTALYLAASTGHHKIVDLMLSVGASVTGRGRRGSKSWRNVTMWYYPPWARDDLNGEALEAAAEMGHMETVTLLLHHKANLGYTGGIHSQPLEAAVFQGHRNIVRIMLHEGATVEKSTLQASIYNGDVEILKALIDKLPEPGPKTKIKPWNYPYMYEPATSLNLSDALYAAALANRLACANLLFDYHVNPNVEINGFYRTPLQAAASYGHIDMIRLLLEHGADVNCESGEWINPHDKAAHYILFNPDLSEATLNSGLEHLARCNNSQFVPPPKCVVIEMPDLKGYIISEDEINAYRESTSPAQVSDGSSPCKSQINDFKTNSSELSEEERGNAYQCPLPSHPEYRSAFWKDLLQDQVDFSRISGRQGNALQAASYAGLYDVVLLLLEMGAKVNTYAGYFGTAIQAAAASGKDDVVALLLKRGAIVNTLSGHFGNPLHAAAAGGSKNIVRMLLNAGARVNARGGEYGYPLQAAARSTDIDIVRLLLDAGANVNALGGYYGYALQAATIGVPASALKTALTEFEISSLAGTQHNFEDYFQYVRNNHARHQIRVRGIFGSMLQNAAGGAFGNVQEVFMNDEDRAKLLYVNASTECRSNEVVKLLLSAGAEPNAHGGKFYSAIHGAAYAGRLDVLKLILERGVDINSRPDRSSSKLESSDILVCETALGNAILVGHVMIVKFLLSKGADPNSGLFDRDYTPLHLAARAADEEIVRLLLEAGADVNSGDFSSQVGFGDPPDDLTFGTPLDEATGPTSLFFGLRYRLTEMKGDLLGTVTLLIDRGADRASRNRGLRNIASSTHPPRKKVMRKLLDSGVDVDSGPTFDPKQRFVSVYPREQQKPLMLLMNEGSEDIEDYQMIVGAGVDMDREGKYLLWAAVRRNLKHVVKFFLDCGVHVDDEILDEAVSKRTDQDGHNGRLGIFHALDEDEADASIQKWLHNKREVLLLLEAARST